jgi:hypothetical protein
MFWSGAGCLRFQSFWQAAAKCTATCTAKTTAECDADFTAAASPYSAGKLAAEAMVAAYSRCYGTDYLIFRLSNVYGRYDNDLERLERVVPLFINQISRDHPVTVFGANKVVDFTHVDDCVDGLLLGIERLFDGRIRNETINLASGCGNTMLGPGGPDRNSSGKNSHPSCWSALAPGKSPAMWRISIRREDFGVFTEDCFA